MSKYQLNTIQKVMGFTPDEAERLVQLMDANNDHPDWSEFSDRQFRWHFKSVLADNARKPVTMTSMVMYRAESPSVAK